MVCRGRKNQGEPPHSTGPYSRSQLLQLTCCRMRAHCSAGTLWKELPFEVSTLLRRSGLPEEHCPAVPPRQKLAAYPCSSCFTCKHIARQSDCLCLMKTCCSVQRLSAHNSPSYCVLCRWWNHLNPAVKKGAFSEWEDAVIIKVTHWFHPTQSRLWARGRSSQLLSASCSCSVQHTAILP
jgi:hypothetical protein